MADVLERRAETATPAIPAERPIPFEEFLDLTRGRHAELIKGVIVEKTGGELEHEKAYGWLLCVVGMYVSHRGLGVVLGSRTAVQIDQFTGRLPDLLFVRQERLDILQERALHGAPDLVMEIVSPNDRPGELTALEADYRLLGVPEIVFLDRFKGRLRVVRKHEMGYEEATLTAGEWHSTPIDGLHLNVAWMLTEPRPDELHTLQALLAETAA